MILTFNHRTSIDEQGAVNNICSGYVLSTDDLNLIQNGHLPNGYQWNEVLHKIFRTYQHQRADNEYVYAQRMLRKTENQEWQGYIDELDQWNESVSALADTFSVNVPDMPARPI